MNDIDVEHLLQIINCKINIEVTSNQLDASLTELGMDSISFIHLVVLLEEELGCEIPDSKLFITELDTVHKIMEVLKQIRTDSVI